MNILFLLENVSFAYDDERQVLANATFHLGVGERVVVGGANGAGKTTLLHLMVGLLRPDAGRITAFGQVRRHETDFVAVRAQAGLLFQDSDDQLFCPTVLEDVAFGPLNLGQSADTARAVAARTLEALGLAGFEDRITHKLSGGQKRLVALATVLAMEPAVLLLDEPTTGLDEATAERLTRILLDLPQSMVIISHDSGFAARMATRKVVMERGRLIAA